MEQHAQNSIPQSYTILRIKRKRNEEPLDALVVESRVRRKKSRGGVGFFQFAQTMEQDAWEDEQRRKDLRHQIISRLAHETSTQTDAQILAPPSPPNRRQSRDEPTRRYKVIEQEFQEPETKNHPTSPPSVIDSKDVPPTNGASDFKMYHAVLSPYNVPESTLDSEMENFLPMLNDYLKLHDITPPSPLNTTPASGNQGTTGVALPGDDYVWDVFYHRPASLSEWNEAANVGTLTGLPAVITDSDDSSSESEEEDQADEDSNAEEYYKNDYPEEEDSSPDDDDGSDEFHEHSDHDDHMQYTDDDEDHSWR